MCAGAVARMSASQSTAFGHCESREIFRLSRSIDEVAEAYPSMEGAVET